MNPTAPTSRASSSRRVTSNDLIGAFHGLWTLVWKSRLGFRRLPRLLTLTLILPLLAVLTVKPGESASFFQLALNLQLMIAMPLVCLITMAGLVRDEAEQGTLAYLSVRPLPRGIFLLLLHAAHLLWIEIIFLGSGLLLLAAGIVLRVPDATGLVLPFLVAQTAGIFAFSGLSAVIGLLTRRYLILGLLYGAIIEVGVGGIPTNINALSLDHHVRVIVSVFTPAAEFLRANEGSATLSLVVLFAVGTLTAGLAGLIYSVREFIDTPDA